MTTLLAPQRATLAPPEALRPADPSLLALTIADTANTYYRLRVPVASIGGAVVPFLGVVTAAQIAAARVVVFSNFSSLPSQPATTAADVVRRLQADGCRVLLDYDDEVRDVPAQHRNPDRNYPAIRLACKAADALVCTNAYLAERLRSLNADVRVVPNYVRPDWTPPQPHPAGDGPTVVTLTGSSSHLRDWQAVAAPLRRIRADYGGRVHIRVAGAMPPYLRGIAHEHRPWGPLSGYRAMLAGTHIGLCPLPDTPFNRCKSPIKAYEFALAGAAVVGSPTQYGEVLSGGRGLVVRSESQWEGAIRAYLDDPSRRAADAAALQRYVVTALDARAHGAAIRAAYFG